MPLVLAEAAIPIREFKTSLVYMVSFRPAGGAGGSYIERPCFKQNKRGSLEPDVVAHTCNPSALRAKVENYCESEANYIRSTRPSGLHSKTLSQVKNRRKDKERRGRGSQGGRKRRG